MEASYSRAQDDSAVDLRARLADTETELARVVRERDYVLRLLRQQQTLSAPRRRYEAFFYFYEAFIRSLGQGRMRMIVRFVPSPAQIKHMVKSIGLKT